MNHIGRDWKDVREFCEANGLSVPGIHMDGGQFADAIIGIVAFMLRQNGKLPPIEKLETDRNGWSPQGPA